MSDSGSDVSPAVARLIADAVDAFQGRRARGEDPDPEEYAARHPEAADDLRRLLKMLRSTPVPAPTPLPRVLGDFKLGEEVGRGGMGVVYEAVQLSLPRRVALKILPFASLVDDRLLKRFHNEARAAASLDHPHIVKVYAAGQDRGVHFIAMQFIDGRPLTDLIRAVHQGPESSTAHTAGFVSAAGPARGTAPVGAGSTRPDARSAAFFKRAAELGGQAADGLEHAHAFGVVHRDVKPGNLLIDAAGAVWVSDFGLARIGAADGSLTMPGDVCGTLRYMSPEQALAKHDLMDHRTDVYSLGATLYELLSGRPVVDGRDREEIIRKITDAEPTPVRRLNPRVPVDLQTVVHKCLQKDPADRYATAKDLADDLRRFAHGEAVAARPVGALGQFTRWRRRNRALTAALALAAVALLAVSAVSVGWAVRERDHAKDLGTALERAEYRLAENYLDQGLWRCEKGDTRAGLLWLVRALEKAPAGADPFRASVRLQLASWGAEVGPLTACLDHPGPVAAAALSPDGGVAWVAGHDRVVRRWVVGSGEVRSEFTLPGQARALLCSPDGRVVLGLCMDGTAQRWEAATGQPIGPPLPHAVRSAAWSADGRILVTGGEDGTVRQWDGLTGLVRAPEFRPAPPAGPAGRAGGLIGMLRDPGFRPAPIVRAVAVTPDGGTILTAVDKAVGFWDAATGLSLGNSLAHPAVVTSVAFHPASGGVLTVNDEHNTQVWDSETRSPLGRQLQHRGMIVTTAFGPDGRTYWSGGHDRAARVWDSATGEPAGATVNHQSAVVAVAVSQDGRRQLTAAADGAVRIWGADPGRARGLVLPHAHNVYSAAFSPDGTRVLTGCWDRKARLFDSATGSPIGHPLPHRDMVMAVAFRPDGQVALTVCWDKSVQQWQVQTGRMIGAPLPHGGWVSQAAFSPDGRTILTGGVDGWVRFWDAETGTPRTEVRRHTGAVLAVAFGPDGRWAATGGEDGRVQVWNAATGQPDGPWIRHAQGRDPEVRTVTFSPDGQSLLTGGRDGRVCAWAVETGASVGHPLFQSGAIGALGLSPDGQTVLAGGEDGTARLWDLAAGRPRGQPLAHQDKVLAAAFSPDGRLALTGSGDGTARLWDAATGKQVGPPMVHDRLVRTAAFSPDGRRMLTASLDGTARVWRVPGSAAGSAADLTLWAERLTGLTMDENDVLTPLSAADWSVRVRRAKTLRPGAP